MTYMPIVQLYIYVPPRTQTLDIYVSSRTQAVYFFVFLRPQIKRSNMYMPYSMTLKNIDLTKYVKQSCICWWIQV